MKPATILFVASLCAPGVASAATVDGRLAEYQRQGARAFSAQAGEALWRKESAGPRGGKPRSCASCHGHDLAAAGRHAETGKVIEPMRPAVNPKRLTDAQHIEKWFLRNCKWTYGRECTPQEKGDFLMFLNH
jgi:hypothetical protein